MNAIILGFNKILNYDNLVKSNDASQFQFIYKPWINKIVIIVYF